MEVDHPLILTTPEHDEKHCLSDPEEGSLQPDGFVFVEKDQEWKEEETEMEKANEKVVEESLSFEEAESLFHRLESDFSSWILLRKDTILSLRSIADYIDSITTKSSMLKALGSGTGVIAGSLTLAGGVLTILSAGAALPILLAGTGIGLASGIAGGTVAVTEKVLKSRQMKAAKAALEEDHAMTQSLETSLAILCRNPRLATQVAKHVILSGGSVVSDSLRIAQLVAGKAGAGTIEAGIRATAQLFGEDISKEVSKILLHTSGKVLSGAVTVVFGGATVIYDIYRLRNEVQNLASNGKDGASDIRTIANELETALEELTCQNPPESQIQSEETPV